MAGRRGDTLALVTPAWRLHTSTRAAALDAAAGFCDWPFGSFLARGRHLPASPAGFSSGLGPPAGLRPRPRNMASSSDVVARYAPTHAQAGGAGRRRRALVFAVVVVGFLIHAPALRSPFVLDDYAQHAMAFGAYPGRPGPFRLYDFVDDAN